MTSLISGWVDAHHRATVNVRFRDAHRSFVVPGWIDTGFNGELLYQGSVPKEISHILSLTRTEVQVVGGTIRVLQAAAYVDWMNETRKVRMLISPSPLGGKHSIPLLIGTGMLSGFRLEIDYLDQLVRIVR